MAENAHLESSLETYFYREVRKRGGIPEKIISMGDGVPDRFALLPGGRVVFIELKQANGKLEPLQEVWHARAAALGTRVLTLYGRTGVDRWLATLDAQQDADGSPRPACRACGWWRCNDCGHTTQRKSRFYQHQQCPKCNSRNGRMEPIRHTSDSVREDHDDEYIGMTSQGLICYHPLEEDA